MQIYESENGGPSVGSSIDKDINIGANDTRHGARTGLTFSSKIEA